MGKRKRDDAEVSVHKAKHSKHRSKKAKKSKDKVKSKKHRNEPSDSDASNLSSEGGVPDFVADQQGVRIAAAYVRAILKKWPALRQQLRDLFWKIDSGEAVDIKGLPDTQLRGALRACFDYLNLHVTSQGAYALRRGQDKILRRVGFVLMQDLPDESDKPLRLPGDPATPADAPIGGPHAQGSSQQPSAKGQASPQYPEHTNGKSTEGKTTVLLADSRKDDDANVQDDALVLSAPAGPMPQRVIGPAAPSQDLLDAAAETAAEMQEEGLLLCEIVDAAGGKGSIGPAPPPAMLAELAGVGQAPRVLEVLRIVALLQSAERAGHDEADPYAVLGLESSASSKEIKKTFWRLSLLIHPDKCSHEKAHEAFQAVSTAAKALQDASQRTAIDEKREDALANAAAHDLVKEEAAQRQWRILRGTATAEDLRAGSLPTGPAKRDEWMTALPAPADRRPAYLEQKSVSQFSQQGAQVSRHDASWTDDPDSRQPSQTLRIGASTGAAPLAYTKVVSAEDSIAAKNAALLAKAASEDSSQAAQAHADPSLGDAAKAQPMSLLEKHQEALKREEKDAKRRKKKEARMKERSAHSDAQVETPGQAEQHPWRPFDRERDIIQLGSKSAWDKLRDGESSLSTRFHKGS